MAAFGLSYFRLREDFEHPFLGRRPDHVMRRELLRLRILRHTNALGRARQVELRRPMLHSGTEHEPVRARLTEWHADAARVDDAHPADGSVELHVRVPTHHDRYIEAIEYGSKSFFRRMTRERFRVAARCSVAEQHVAESGNLELHGKRP